MLSLQASRSSGSVAAIYEAHEMLPQMQVFACSQNAPLMASAWWGKLLKCWQKHGKAAAETSQAVRIGHVQQSLANSTISGFLVVVELRESGR